MSALDELVKKDLQKYSALEHTIFRVWCEGKSSKDEMSDTILLMADLAATELAALQERGKELLEKIAMARAQLRSTQYNWQEDCLFKCDDILTSALGEAQ